MKVTRPVPEGLILIEPDVFTDDRGYFFESYSEPKFHQEGITHSFVQDNQSLSDKNVLRGLHFQNPPYEQGKLVRVVTGSVLDVAVDIRKSSPTYGRHYSVVLSGDNKKMLWIPPGFAHGFIALEDQTLFLYKCTKPYHKASEQGIIWNDKTLNINWGTTHPRVSSKDLELGAFDGLVTEF